MNNNPPAAQSCPVLKQMVRKLKAPVLRRLSKQSFKMYQALIKDLTTEQRRELLPLYDHMSNTWQLFYDEEKRRALVEAERKDRGEVLFEVFYPRASAWHRGSSLTRTPNRKILRAWYADEPIVSVESPDDWLKDFRKAQVAA